MNKNKKRKTGFTLLEIIVIFVSFSFFVVGVFIQFNQLKENEPDYDDMFYEIMRQHT